LGMAWHETSFIVRNNIVPNEILTYSSHRIFKNTDWRH
jgi:hypothetical protein